MKNADGQLKQRSLKSTPVRRATLEFFNSMDKAVSHSELEKAFPEFDRVTLYRTLHSFEEKGLIHKVIDERGGLKYSPCKHHCSDHDHEDLHLHFSCEVCETTVCVDSVTTEPPQLPSGYQLKNYFTLATGICSSCSSKN